MYSNEQIQSKLQDIFVETTWYNPFEKDSFYHQSISQLFCLDELDIIEMVVRIEKEFRIHISADEYDRIGLMSIDELVEFVSSKYSKQ